MNWFLIGTVDACKSGDHGSIIDRFNNLIFSDMLEEITIIDCLFCSERETKLPRRVSLE